MSGFCNDFNKSKSSGNAAGEPGTTISFWLELVLLVVKFGKDLTATAFDANNVLRFDVLRTRCALESPTLILILRPELLTESDLPRAAVFFSFVTFFRRRHALAASNPRPIHTPLAMP